jgi:23S rRNA pseudouridine1911/1915/1917 synthase
MKISTNDIAFSLHDSLLFEDAALIAVNKPPALPTQPTKTGEGALLTRLEKDLNQPLFVVHRLDQPASGIVVFAKNQKAAAALSGQFHDRETKKIYWAVVDKAHFEAKNGGDTEGGLLHYLKHNTRSNKSFVVESNTPQAKRAELHWILRGASERYNLLEINLLTGRHHQIRAQLAAFGCPIKGDVKYGARRSNADHSICLHARFLELTHPVLKTKINLTAAPPDDVLWRIWADDCPS